MGFCCTTYHFTLDFFLFILRCLLYLFSSYTKLGYAGNTEPQFIFPSAIAVKDANILKSAGGKIPDLDFFIGDEALSPAAANYFVKVSP